MSTANETQEVHLIVLQHGLWGVAANLAFLENLLTTYAKEHSYPVRILNSDVNQNTTTYDGIDMAGDRVVKLIKHKVTALSEESCKVTRLSLIGYSLGGLIMRYAVGKLEREGAFTTRFTPVNFITIASPHLGAWMLAPPDSSAASCIARAYNRAYHDMVPVISSVTGYQLMLKDGHAFDRPLLMNMSEPELPFFQGLERFQQRICLANIRYDNMVPYRSAAICKVDPYLEAPGVTTAQDPVKYPSVVRPSNGQEASRPPPELGGTFLPLIFLCLLPVMLPILLIVLCAMSVQGRKHYCKSTELRKDMGTSWLERASSKRQQIADEEAGVVPQTQDTTDVVLGRLESVRITFDPTRANTREKQEWMVDMLSKLSWQKVDVDPRHRRAHAAIVVRNPKQCDKCDHLHFLMESMKW